MDDVPGVAIERRRDALPSRTAGGELVRVVGGQLARAGVEYHPPRSNGRPLGELTK